MKNSQKILLPILMSCASTLLSMEDQNIFENLVSDLELLPLPFVDDDTDLIVVDTKNTGSTDDESTDDESSDCQMTYTEQKEWCEFMPDLKQYKSVLPRWEYFSYETW